MAAAMMPAALLRAVRHRGAGAECAGQNGRKEDTLALTAGARRAMTCVAPGVTTLGKITETAEVAQSVQRDRSPADGAAESHIAGCGDDARHRRRQRPFVLLTTAWYARSFKIDSFELDGVPTLLSNTASSPQGMAVYERGGRSARSSTALLHGLPATAATVNMVRKHGLAQNRAQFTASAGSWNRYRGEADGRPAERVGRVRGRAVMAWEDRVISIASRIRKPVCCGATVDADLTPDTLLRVGAQYQTLIPSPIWPGVPMGKDGSDLHLPRSTYLGRGLGSLQMGDTTRLFAAVGASAERRLAGQAERRLSARQVSPAVCRRGATADPGHRRRRGADGRRLSFRNQQLGLDASLNGKIDAWGLRHELVVGASYTHAEEEQFTARFDSVFQVPVNVTAGIRTACRSQRSALNSPGSTKTVQHGVYGMGRIKLAEPLTRWWPARAKAGGRVRPATLWKKNARLTPTAA
ncbi:hypothetical protein M8494_25290 [Serratia ureilytica]